MKTRTMFKVQWTGANTGSKFSALVATQGEVDEISNRRTTRDVRVAEVQAREVIFMSVASWVEFGALDEKLLNVVRKAATRA